MRGDYLGKNAGRGGRERNDDEERGSGSGRGDRWSRERTLGEGIHNPGGEAGPKHISKKKADLKG